MGRVEASENIGPEPIRSLDGIVIPTQTSTILVENFTKHAYQVICNGVNAGTDAAFFIYGSNLKGRWIKIANYQINNGRNKDGILHFDTWNFKYAKCRIMGTFNGANFSVIEKHNA
jgi:hypothetical protein|tara:strand:+ start:226 stop:573 length:348 start_codon:yes stop_codon:yes gene_type:complete